MTQLRFTALLLLLLLSTTGCVTSIGVKKVALDESKTEPTPGLRYSLPATFLVVKPDPKTRGGFSIEPQLFPDYAETYAITPATYLGSFTFNVELTEGMLKKVTIKKGSDAVAAEAIKAAGEVAKSELEESQKKKEEAEKAAQAKSEKKKNLEEAVAKAEAELQLARIDVAEWEKIVAQVGNNSLPALQGLTAAKLRLAKAEIELQRANQALAEFLSDNQALSDAADDVGDALNKVDATSDTDAIKAADDELGQVYGPVFYRLVDTCDPWAEHVTPCEVKLVPVNWKDCPPAHQLKFPVSAVRPPPADEPKEPELLDERKTPEPVTFEKSIFKKSMPLSQKICDLNLASSKLQNVTIGSEVDIKSIGIVLLSGGSSIQIEIKEGVLTGGEYRLQLLLVHGDCKKDSKSTPIAYRFKI